MDTIRRYILHHKYSLSLPIAYCRFLTDPRTLTLSLTPHEDDLINTHIEMPRLHFVIDLDDRISGNELHTNQFTDRRRDEKVTIPSYRSVMYGDLQLLSCMTPKYITLLLVGNIIRIANCRRADCIVRSS